MSLGLVVPLGNWQRGGFPTGVIVLQVSCPWGSCPQGSYPRGSCPQGSCLRTYCVVPILLPYRYLRV